MFVERAGKLVWLEQREGGVEKPGAETRQLGRGLLHHSKGFEFYLKWDGRGFQAKKI